MKYQLEGLFKKFGEELSKRLLTPAEKYMKCKQKCKGIGWEK